MENQTNNISLRFLRENWPILAFLVGIIFVWSNTQSTLNEYGRRIDKTEVQYEQALRDIGTLKEKMVEVKTLLEVIQKQTLQIK